MAMICGLGQKERGHLGNILRRQPGSVHHLATQHPRSPPSTESCGHYRRNRDYPGQHSSGHQVGLGAAPRDDQNQTYRF